MATTIDPTEPTPRRRRPPAKTQEGREKQLIASAYDLAENLIDTGKAPAPVIMHFLKMGSSREALEQRMIDRNIHLADARIDEIASQARIESLYGEAMDAMRSYQGRPENEDD